MKRPFISLMTLLAALALIGAGCTRPATPAAPQAGEPELSSAPYVGTWERLSLAVDGQPQEAVPATIELSADSYVSTTFCTVSGALQVEGEDIVMTLGNTDCPTGAIPDVYHSRMLLSEGGEHMTLINTEFGAEVREEYSRK